MTFCCTIGVDDTVQPHNRQAQKTYQDYSQSSVYKLNQHQNHTFKNLAVIDLTEECDEKAEQSCQYRTIVSNRFIHHFSVDNTLQSSSLSLSSRSLPPGILNGHQFPRRKVMTNAGTRSGSTMNA